LYGLVLILGICIVLNTFKGETLLFINSNHNEFLDYFFFILTKIVEIPVFILLAFLLLFYSYRASIQVGLVGILSLLISGSLKMFFAFPRPALVYTKNKLIDSIHFIEYLIPETGYTSFPSGHATAAFALMLSLSIIFKKKWFTVIAVFLAIGTAISRIYLINHFLEDVLAGSLLGIYIALVTDKILSVLKIPENKSILQLKLKR
jgi:membrane-associated phospholipid phosphatase